MAVSVSVLPPCPSLPPHCNVGASYGEVRVSVWLSVCAVMHCRWMAITELHVLLRNR